ncbi:MAG TPA: FAD-binding oxidoreductase [Streptosporangiaceae bacterium]|nr:FAD-binding oxidoreductase [Streptosporangiaceae bacterium]
MTSQPATGGRPPPRSAAVPDALAQACANVRQAGEADAVAGVQPGWVAAPASVAEAAAAMRAAAELGLSVVPRGSGSRLSWGLPPDSCDLVIETGGLDRVIEHAHGDWVASVQAGVTLEHLAEVLAVRGQRLTLDVPAPAGGGQGTVGGVLATGMAGPKRLRYGTPRDLLTGVTIVRPDGLVAKSGGKVVKNVAGYDMGKLFAGSYGTLGLIAEATFRLHPVPAAVAYVSTECATAAQAAGTVAAAVQSPLQPSAVEIDRPAPGGPIGVSVLLEGNPAGVPARVDGMLGLLGGGAAQSPTPPAWWGHGAGDGTLIRIAFWAGRLESILDAADAAAAAAGLRPVMGGSPGAGVLYAVIDGLAEPAAVASYVTELRNGAGHAAPAMLPPVRGSVVVLAAPPKVRERVDLWGPTPAAAVMRSVKHQFDPGHRMAPGRFAGGI